MLPKQHPKVTALPALQQQFPYTRTQVINQRLDTPLSQQLRTPPPNRPERLKRWQP